ncbi:FecR domain-containing protein, partial [bacterium]|nr:FecR domain-containing protein [bacterium]
TITLANGTALEQHDVITTKTNSQVQLTFEDKTIITLGSESILDIKEYLNDAQDPKAKFKFNQGTFKSITGQIGKKAPENFNLETKTATIGIRGTTVAGQLGGNGANGIPESGKGRIHGGGCLLALVACVGQLIPQFFNLDRAFVIDLDADIEGAFVHLLCCHQRTGYTRF